MKYDGAGGVFAAYSSTRLRYVRWTAMIFDGSTGARYVTSPSGTVRPPSSTMASPSRRPQHGVPSTATLTLLSLVTVSMVLCARRHMQQQLEHDCARFAIGFLRGSTAAAVLRGGGRGAALLARGRATEPRPVRAELADPPARARNWRPPAVAQHAPRRAHPGRRVAAGERARGARCGRRRADAGPRNGPRGDGRTGDRLA